MFLDLNKQPKFVECMWMQLHADVADGCLAVVEGPLPYSRLESLNEAMQALHAMIDKKT
jgi:hypothetical protein